MNRPRLKAGVLSQFEPATVGGQSNLIKMPYDAGWQSGQYHATWNTTDASKFGNDRHRLTVEVFDAGGTQLRPVGTMDTGGTVEAPLSFRRWYQELDQWRMFPSPRLLTCFGRTTGRWR